MDHTKRAIIQGLIQLYPAVAAHLRAPALSVVKTYDFFLRAVEGLVRGVYNGQVGGDFVDALANLIEGQINQAFAQAYEDEAYTDFYLPDYLREGAEAMIERERNFDWIYQYYTDIVDARVDETSISPLLARGRMWANLYNEAYSESLRLMTLANGGNMVWQLGEAEHCSTCLALDGIVASASEWDVSGWRPQSPELECKGFNCKCSLTPTDRRRSPKALDTLMNIKLSAHL